jgi:putative tryptophan/tyrosine transport system substrate-binding protein
MRWQPDPAGMWGRAGRRPDRRQVLRGLVGLGLAAGLPLLDGCDRSSSSSSREPAAARMHRIGWLHDGEPLRWATGEPWTESTAATSQRLKDRLAELGYVEGRNLHQEFRRAPTPDQLAAAAAELVALPVALILTTAAPLATRAAFDAPGTTPVVMCAGSNDPVKDGYAQSLSRPGGKLTGVIYIVPGAFGAKRLELLKEVMPGLARVGFLYDVGDASVPAREAAFAALEPAARELGLELIYAEVRTLEEWDGAVAALAAAGAQVVVPSTRADWTGRVAMERLSQVALRHRLPILGLNRVSTEVGALVGYAPDPLAIWTRAAEYVDMVLRGARPAELPIEQPTTYNLSLNLRVARDLGLTIPPAVLGRATEVFQ